MTAHNFGQEFQRATLRLAIDDAPFCALACKHFRPSFFESQAMMWVFSVIQDYHENYNRPPSLLVLRQTLNSLDPDVASMYAPTVEAVAAAPATEAEFIIDNVVHFVKRNLFVEGFAHARQLYNNNDVDAAYDFMQRRTEEIHAITVGDVDRGFFFEEFDKRQKEREHWAATDSLHTFSTGIPDLDRVLGGGLSRGELGAWIAHQKAGKSMLLVWLAFWAVRALRVQVLVTIHEGGRSMWESRLDAAFAETKASLVLRGELTAETHRDLVDEYREMHGLLVTRGYTKDSETWNATVLDIANELKELRAQRGFRPGLVVVDYADLLRSRDGTGLSETQHQTAAWKDLKGLCDKDDGYAIWTASQAQRKDPKADRDPGYFLRADNIADAIGKVRVADIYGSINRTSDEKEAGEARLFIEDYRSGPTGAGRVIHVETDYENGRFIRNVLRSHKAPSPQPVLIDEG